MKRSTISILIVFTIIFSSSVHADVSGVTKVMLVKAPLLSTLVARDMLLQINETFSESGLGETPFVSATFQGGSPRVYDLETCTSTVAETFLNCAKGELSALRDSIAADIVLILVGFLDSENHQDICGSVMQPMVNPVAIEHFNHRFAFAAVESTCFATEIDGIKVASHEVGHLLSLEHVADPKPYLPAGADANHAATYLNKATVMAVDTDCATLRCEYQDFFSKSGRSFAGGGSAGNSSYSNAHNVILSTSWDVVKNYRPQPPPPPCEVSVTLMSCNFLGNGNFQVTASLPGYTVTNADYDVSIGGGPWWDIFEGALTCPTFNLGATALVRAILATASGNSTCTTNVYIPPYFCDEGGQVPP